jgi:hypothetical protein
MKAFEDNRFIYWLMSFILSSKSTTLETKTNVMVEHIKIMRTNFVHLFCYVGKMCLRSFRAIFSFSCPLLSLPHALQNSPITTRYMQPFSSFCVLYPISFWCFEAVLSTFTINTSSLSSSSSELSSEVFLSLAFVCGFFDLSFIDLFLCFRTLHLV